MAYKHGVDHTPIKGPNWTLHFGLNESTGGVNSGGTRVNFTCASAVMWNVNFIRNSDGYNAYSHLGQNPVPIEERYALYDKLVERYVDNTFMVQLVGVINGGTAARLKHYLSSENKLGYHTADFANYLISKKIGVVVESPMFINTYHKWEGPSMCQAWFWFSPSILKQGALVEGTGGIYGLDTVPKYLQDSEINKENVGGFNGLVNPVLAKEPRHSKASDIWNAAMKKAGIKVETTDDTTKEEAKAPSKWKKLANF